MKATRDTQITDARAGGENSSTRLSDERPSLFSEPAGDEASGCTGIRLSRPVEWAALAAVLIFGAVLNLWRLDRNGYGNVYYAAAARSMSGSWHNYVFGALDPAGFITVDKPPLALWVQAASVWMFGLSSWSLLVPAAAAGTVTVFALYHAVRAQVGALGGLVAALALTVTPVFVSTARFNNPDPFMVMLLVLAAWALVASVRQDSGRLLALAAVCVGLAFDAKMLQAYLVVPALGLVYLVAAPGGLRRRLALLGAATLALVVASGAWMALVDLTPKAHRPFVGGSTDNTVRDLVFGYNGLGRVDGSGGQGAFGAVLGSRRGPGRFFDATTGGLIAWLIPVAVAAALLGLWQRRRAPRTDPARAAVLLWGTWALLCWLVLSFARGAFHPYYVGEAAPAFAALVGVGFALAAAAWSAGGVGAGGRVPTTLAAVAGLVSTVAVAVLVLRRTPTWNAWLRPTLIVAAVISAGMLALAARAARRAGGPGEPARGRAAPATAALAGVLALAVVLAAPTAFALTPLRHPSQGSDPVVGPPRTTSSPLDLALPAQLADNPALRALRQLTEAFPQLTRSAQPVTRGLSVDLVTPSLLAYLRAHREGAKFLVAVDTDPLAAPTIAHTGEAVMPMGGFLGSDPAPTVSGLAALVRSHALRHVLLLGGGASGGSLISALAAPIAGERDAWVRHSCTLVPAAKYGGGSGLVSLLGQAAPGGAPGVPGVGGAATGGAPASPFGAGGIPKPAIDISPVELLQDFRILADAFSLNLYDCQAPTA